MVSKLQALSKLTRERTVNEGRHLKITIFEAEVTSQGTSAEGSLIAGSLHPNITHKLQV